MCGCATWTYGKREENGFLFKLSGEAEGREKA